MNGLTHTLTAWRRRWYDAPHRRRTLGRPVISVGNLAFGGRGKTPMVAHLARLLVAAGERPAILTRGYARSEPQDGVVVVSDGVHCRADLARSGDEPLMLAQSVPGAAVLVSEDRALAGALAERAFDVTVHLLDDGFQHVQLERDIDLVLVSQRDLDTHTPGRLRESPAALRYADAVIAEDAEPVTHATGTAFDGRDIKSFHLRRTLGQPTFFNALGAPPPSARAPALEDSLSSRGPRALLPPSSASPILAVAGIAEPERFTRALAAAGYVVARSIAFRDHHQYTATDLAQIAAALSETGAECVLTTEKDAMRLRPLRPLPFAVAVVPLEISVDPAAEFREWILERLAEARH